MKIAEYSNIKELRELGNAAHSVATYQGFLNNKRHPLTPESRAGYERQLARANFDFNVALERVMLTAKRLRDQEEQLKQEGK